MSWKGELFIESTVLACPLIRSSTVTAPSPHRLANNTRGMLQSLLGVTDSQHKQKLRLRAMDLVLFGPPNGGYFSLSLFPLTPMA